MAEPAVTLSQLSREDLDLLLEQLKREKGKRQAVAAVLGPRPRDGGPLPLSFAQQRLWLLEELDPGSAAYNVAGGLRMQGALAVAALGGGLAEIVRRHEALRTTFGTRGGVPVANIAPSLALPLPVVDLSALGAGTAEAALAALGEADARRPFDLGRGPLLRALLVRLAERRYNEQQHGLLLALHHIVSDGWSLGVLVRELAVLYHRSSSSQGAGLPELGLQYADFAAWQREHLSGEVLERQLAYWRQALADLPAALELPADRPRPAVASLGGRRLELAVPAPLGAGLAALSRQSGATPFMVVLAAYAALLARLTGQRDLVVGTTIANRNRSEVEGLIGFFVNTLALRIRVAGDSTFQQLLAGVRETTLSAYQHQDMPFEKLVEELAPARSLSHSPLFQAALDYQADPMAGVSLPGLALERVDFDGGTAKFDLLLSLSEGDRGLRGYLEYATDLFDESTARRFARLFETVLGAVVASPEGRLSALPLLAAAERHQLLAEWGPVAASGSSESCLHQLFEAQALRTPAAEALVDGDGMRLTYRELDLRAEALAGVLRAAGVGPEVRVGVCLERRRGMVVALLAVLKAGGTYVPFDPLPADGPPPVRLRQIFDDSRMALLITQESFVDRLPDPASAAGVLIVDADGVLTTALTESASPPGIPVSPDNLAYLIYTSGSTGRPKGVAISHRSIVTLAHWARGAWSDGERAGVFAATSICFDISVFEIFVTLAWGGKVILAANVLDLPAHPAVAEVTLVNTVPSAITELARQDALPPGAATLNLAGEALKRSLVDQLFELPHVTSIWNLYGPSEDTTYTTYYRPPRGERRRPAIGRPVAGSSAYLLDRAGRPVPLGVPGEVCLAGAGLARGYLDRPAQTAEKFVPDPISGRPGGRLYRTGDLARFLPESELDYLGRIDHQVKVRGFRIELGEIEAALHAHPLVAEAVVSAREVIPGETSLIAYLVPREGLDLAELRRFLGARLPEYMVPPFVVELAALPLNANGKVDRRALPAPRREGDGAAAPVAPRTPLEARLAKLFAEVLEVERVGVEDNFFRLGGHSLRASQLVSRLRDTFATELPLRLVFEHPTVALLASQLEKLGAPAALRDEPTAETLGALLAEIRQGADTGPPAVPPALVRRPREGGPLPLSFAQQRLWFLHGLDPGSPAYNIAGGLRLSGPLAAGALAAALAEVARRHEALRTVFVADDGPPEQRVLPAARTALPVVDLSALAGGPEEALVALAERDARQPFDLERGPLFRALLVRLPAGDHALLLAMHHIVSDGWSLGVLVRELAVLYPHLAQGSRRRSPLPELAVQYADFAAWQRDWLQGEELERQLAYWRQALAGLPPALELPTDRPRPAVQSLAGRRLAVVVPAALRDELAALAQQEGGTLFMVLLAAFQALLGRWTGQGDVVVGASIANRNRSQIEGLIGFFVNTLALRSRLDGEASFRQLLAAVRETTLAAYAHQDLPFEKLVEVLAPVRSLATTPLVQAVLGLQADPLAGARLGGLAIERIEPGTGTAKFDLLLALAEGQGGLAGFLEYASDLFDAATMERLLAQLGALLRSAAAAPDRPLFELLALSPAERAELTARWAAAPRRIETGAGALPPAATRAPATPTEKDLAELYGQLLGLERVGAEADFFALGGHSLLATRLVSRLRKEWAVEVPLRRLFELPTVAALAAEVDRLKATQAPARLSGLSREKLGQVLARLKREKAEREPAAEIPRRERGGEPLPLSFAQQRLWFLHALDPGSPAYNVAGGLRLEGELDTRALARGLAAIVERHESLRTVFADRDGVPEQIVLAAQISTLPVLDLSALPPASGAAALAQLSAAEAKRPFDLERGPLLRPRLMRLAERRHALLLNSHHIVADGWSVALLVSELGALYGHYAAGGALATSPLPALPIQYADFAAWQREWMTGETLAQQMGYWREALAGLPAALELPADRPRPAVASLAGGWLPVALPAPLSRGLAALARGEGERQGGATLFMVLLAGFQALLSRYTGRRDLVVGTTIANRNRSEIEGLIGFFVNTLALRSRLDGALPFHELLARVRETTLAAYSHQDLPFEKLVDEVAPARSLSHSPLFQVAMDFQSEPLGSLRLPGLAVEPIAVPTGTAKFDLVLSLSGNEERLAGYLEYARDLFDPTTIARLLAHLENLLAGAVEAPERRLAELPLLSAAERHEVAVEMRETAELGVPDGSLAGLFAAQAAAAPEAIALVTEDGCLSYGELSRRAARLAGTLAAAGVGPEVLVGICLARSAATVVSMLAVHYAGGAYVGFDPPIAAPGERAAPPERLAFLLADSRPQVLLTQAELVDFLPEHQAAIIALDRSGSAVTPALASAAGGRSAPLVHVALRDPAAALASPRPEDQADGSLIPALAFPQPESGGGEATGWGRRAQRDGVERVDPSAAPREGARQSFVGPVSGKSLSHLIYTSGSTGKPKGVAIEHRATMVLAHWARSVYSDWELGGVSAVTSICWDVSVAEILVPLALGGRVILARNALHLADHPAAPEMRLVTAVPSAVTELVRMAALPANAVTVHLPGEALKRTLVDAVYAVPGVKAAVNLYGPSEDTTYSTWEVVPPGERRAPTVGRPVANTRAYVVDAQLRPRPLGIPGQLFLAGEGVSRGYHARPGLTAERYVPDPLSGRPGARMYTTGDLVRFLPDARLDFLGRLDHQVKVRGFRVELGEIEAALLAHPRVREAVVVARQDALGTPQLVAYLSRKGAGDTAEIPAAELSAFLAGRLPDFMVPARFVELPALPLNANGKVDRAALPAPAGGLEGGAAQGYVEPRTPTEVALAALFAEILGEESLGGARVGAHDSFFALGGHSLSATRLVSRLRRDLGAELPLRTVFEHPTVTALAGAVDLATAGERQTALASITPLPRSEGSELPLSFAQQRLWLLDKLDPGSVAYLIPAGFVIRGPLDVGALEASLAEIVRRHEALRTVFTEESGRPVARVVPAALLPLPVIDLVGEATAGERADEIGRDLARRPFDLGTWPLLRWALIRLAPDEHRLLVVMHHIVTDGWSMGVLVGELAALYPAFAAGGRPALPALAIQYADFAAWQREWLAAGAGERQLGYWRSQLADLPALELPADRPRPAVQSLAGATYRFGLPRELTERLDALAAGHGATLFMALLAGFEALLSRLSGQRGFAVGSPVAGRNRAEVEPLIGFFVNTLVLRADLSGRPSFHQLLDRARETAMAAYAHQDLPFEQMVEELAPARDLSYTPFFQVMLALQNVAEARLELPGLALAPLPLDTGTAKFDLLLSLTETENGLAASLEYGTALYDGATVRRWMRSFEALLAAAVAAPEAALASLPWLAAVERQQVFVELAAQGPAVSSEICLHHLFEEQVRRQPGKVALVTVEERLTYAELDARAERLARALAARGVGPETRVGVCLDRNASLVVALFAVHKAGGAYVPFDPLPISGPPPERVAMIFEDSRMSLLITQESFVDRLPEVARLLVDAQGAPLAAEDFDAPLARAHPDNLAYLIYTSGSTGRPKGVAISHRPAVVLAHWSKRIWSAEEFEGVLGSTSICFDMSVFEIFVTLGWGGKLILARNALHLAEHPAANEVRLVNTVPSAAAELVRMRAIPPSVMTVNLGGEALKGSLVEEVYGVPGVRTVCNLYGPSEDTTYSTWYCPRRGERRSPAIGRPVDGTTAYLLDRDLSPVTALGVPGELFLGGTGLSRGYLDRPAMTAERYLPDPFAPNKFNVGAGGRAGDRMYRTGDLVRFLPDGEMDYLGRIDHQVKVRGFRIELGEVEAALARHPQVREAVVVARERVPGETGLVGYLVPVAGELDVEDLRRFAAAKLPDYMVPPVLVLLEAMPLNANGKVDRKALIASHLAASGRAPAGEGHVAPRTPAEAKLAEIFAEILFGEGGAGTEAVSIHDSFFRLGGHSLTATRLVSRLREELGVELPLRAVFEAPTVAALAGRIEGAGVPVPGAVAELPLAAGERPEELPLSFAQERLWFLDLFEPGNAAYNVPTALALDGELVPRAIAACFTELARRHESLRTTFGSTAGRSSQRVAASIPMPLPVVDLSVLPASNAATEADRLRGAEAARPFDLACGPLLRATLVKLADRRHHLLIDGHHIAVDGWSITLLVRELATLYAAFCPAGAFLEHRPSPLAPLPLQYADFALWQRRWLAGAELERQLSYWRGQLAGAPQGLELPTDWPRAAVRTYSSGSHEAVLETALVARLTAIAERRNASLFMALLAGFEALLSRLSGEEDVVVGTPIAGRNRAALEGLIGMFLNTLVLRTDLSGAPSYETLIDRVRDTALAAYAHQDLPFEKLLDELKPERDLSRTPLFQVFFNMLNLPAVDARLPGLDIGLLAPPEVPSKFDLTVYAQPVEGPQKAQQIKLHLVYNADLFSRARIAELARQLVALYEALAAEPTAEIGTVPLVTGEARPALPDPAVPLSAAWHGAIHQLASRQAAARPDRIALQEAGAAWSYGKLEAESNRLAHHLVALGVAPGDAVAVYAHRSAAVAWAVLGALKAGGVFVMLDPAYPEERLAQMLRMAGPKALLRLAAAGALPARLESFLAEDLRCPVVALPAIGDPAAGAAFAARPASPPAVEVGPESPACLGFTSGSTGVPKGVVGRHGPLTHFLPWQCRRFGLGDGDRFSLLSGLAHDPLQRDLFTPLYLGAAICVPEPGEILVAGGAAGWMARQAVSVAHLTPAMGQVLTEPGASGANEKLSALRFVLLVGDVLTRRDAGRIRDLAPGVTVVNLYGSTETQRAVSYHVVDGEAGPGGGEKAKQVLPCGMGMEDVQLLVLNRRRQLAGVGELGEIHVRSPHLAAGYLDDPELTAERFLANPFAGPDGFAAPDGFVASGAAAGDRLYRTGDLGRYLPNGEVVFVGRADKQVKIRGFRVELGEIEAAIGRLPGVLEAVVLLKPAPAGDARLVAYVVASDDQAGEAEAGEIKEALRRKLPAYMVPAAVVLLARLPLTPNGKVDREALKKMSDTKPDGRALEGPQTDAERIVLGLFRDLLQVEQLGVEDNFFEMGGNSLLLVQLQSRLQQAFSRPVAMVDLFDHPTIRALARHLTPAEATRPASVDDEQWGERLKEGRNRLKKRSRALAGAGPGTPSSGASDEQFGEP